MIHVVPLGDLRRAAMTTAVMGDDAIPLRQKEQHLRVPVVGAQRPAVMEHDRLRILRTPILVEDFGAVCGGHKAHGFLLCLSGWWLFRGVTPVYAEILDREENACNCNNSVD
ncbi:hypothetical protein D3C71_1813930 [compost metagenome]